MRSAADITAKNDFAIEWASNRGHLEIVKYLHADFLKKSPKLKNSEAAKCTQSAMTAGTDFLEKSLQKEMRSIFRYHLPDPLYHYGYLEVFQFLRENRNDKKVVEYFIR